MLIGQFFRCIFTISQYFIEGKTEALICKIYQALRVGSVGKGEK